jgi:hypothetical protein
VASLTMPFRTARGLPELAEDEVKQAIGAASLRPVRDWTTDMALGRDGNARA